MRRRKRAKLIKARKDGVQIFETKRGEIFNIGGLGALHDPAVGEEVFLSYQTGAGFGLWFASRR